MCHVCDTWLTVLFAMAAAAIAADLESVAPLKSFDGFAF